MDYYINRVWKVTKKIIPTGYKVVLIDREFKGLIHRGTGL